MKWNIINGVVAVVGLLIWHRGYLIGQKSEAYGCIGWLAVGCILVVAAAISIVVKYFHSIWF